MSSMWSDPSLVMDLNYLQLLPSLDEYSLCEYPIEGNQLVHLMNQAVEAHNIPATIGATLLLFLKNELPSQRKEFPVVHLGSLDRIFYLLSEASLTSKVQNQLYRLVQLAVRRWFSQAPREELLKIQLNLKAELNLFEKVMQLVKEASEQKKELIIKLLKTFVGLLSHEKGTVAAYGEKFKDHGLYICKNKKELFLLNTIYEIEFLLTEQIHRQTDLYCPSDLIEHLRLKLLGVTVCRRTSVNIQNTAFLLRKLFQVKHKHRIPQSLYHQFLLQMEEHCDKIFSRSNLSLRTSHYAFHMKNSHFFPFLEAIFDPALPHQYCVISKWRAALSEAIQAALPHECREVKEEDIEEAVFYLQLRDWQHWLWSDTSTQEVNEFPLVSCRVVSRLIRDPLLRGEGVGVSSSIVSAVERGEGAALFGRANLLERSILFYYIHYYQYYSFFSSQDALKKGERALSLHRFKHSLPLHDLLPLLEFYLLEIQLGNFYKVAAESCPENENSVNRLLYESFIEIFSAALSEKLLNYKGIQSTQQLLLMKGMGKYLVLLVKAVSEEEVPMICLGCKQTGQYEMCGDCGYLCLGLRLQGGKSPLGLGRDRFFYEQVLGRVREECREAQWRVGAEGEGGGREWLRMLGMVLESLLPL